MIAGKVFKARCQRCGAEHLVEASKPGLLLFVCSSCGAQHALLLDQNLDLRDLRLLEAVEAMPAGVYEVSVTDDTPTTLRDLLARLKSGGRLEDLESALRLARRLGLLRVVG
jgi:DNA-directed RNA polymerase subunit RPC12/RpoP